MSCQKKVNVKLHQLYLFVKSKKLTDNQPPIPLHLDDPDAHQPQRTRQPEGQGPPHQPQAGCGDPPRGARISRAAQAAGQHQHGGQVSTRSRPLSGAPSANTLSLYSEGRGWWLTQATGSATVLATATLVAILPQVLIGPFAGTLVDRWPRRVVMIVADSFIALATLGLLLLFATGRMQVWHVYAIMCFRSAMGAFHWPAMQASTSLMVPGQHLARVAGLNQTLHGVVGIVAPPLGALLLSFMSLHAVLAVDVITALMAIAPLLIVAVPQPSRTALSAGAGPGATVWSDLRTGLRYVWGWSGLLGVLVLAMVLNFVLTPASSLMPLLVTKHFGGDALHLGWLESAIGIGVVTGGLVLGAWGGFRRRIITSLLGVVGIGAGVAVVGAAPAHRFVLALAGNFVTGFMSPMANGPLMAILQARVAPEMQGRVLALIQSGATAMMPLSLLLAGPLADAVGVRVWYVAGGLLCAAIALSGLAVPAIVQIEENGHAAAASTLEAPAAGC